MVESSLDKKETTSWRLQGTFKKRGKCTNAILLVKKFWSRRSEYVCRSWMEKKEQWARGLL